jgi:hypothetical protein
MQNWYKQSSRAAFCPHQAQHKDYLTPYDTITLVNALIDGAARVAAEPKH